MYSVRDELEGVGKACHKDGTSGDAIYEVSSAIQNWDWTAQACLSTTTPSSLRYWLISQFSAYLPYNWYYSRNFETYQKHLFRQPPDTGSWIPYSSEFQAWESASNASNLYVSPSLGFAAQTIDYLQSKNDTTVLYFFFDKHIETNPEVTLLEFLFQLMDQESDGATFDELCKLQQSGEETTLKVSEIFESQVRRLISTGSVYFVIDGTGPDLFPLYAGGLKVRDDNSGRRSGLCGLYSLLRTFVENDPVPIKILVMGYRFCHGLQNYRHLLLHLWESDTFAREQSLSDMRAFLLDRMVDFSSGGQEALREKVDGIVEHIRRGSEGWLYANLLVELMRLAKMQGEALSQPPASLEDMFVSLLKRYMQLAGDDGGTRKDSSLIWTLHAFHELTVPQFNDLNEICPRPNAMIMTSDLSSKFASDVLIPFGTILYEFFEDEYVRPVNCTLDTKYCRTTNDYGPPAHARLAMEAIEYLSRPTFRSNWPSERGFPPRNESYCDGKGLFSMGVEKAVADRLESNPFLEYATSNWMRHLQAAGPFAAAHFEKVDEFLAGTTEFRNWLRLYFYQQGICPYDDIFSPVHIAAYFNLTDYGRYLLENKKVDLTELEQVYWATPLRIATTNGNIAFVQLLLDHGAPVNDELDQRKDRNSLYFAVSQGNLEMVDVLLNAGADPLPDRSIATPFSLAVESTNQDILERILEHVVKGPQEMQVKALRWLANKGSSPRSAAKAAAIRTMLHMGLQPLVADIGTNAAWDRSALLTAVDTLHIEAIEALLAMGANPRKGDAMHACVKHHYYEYSSSFDYPLDLIDCIGLFLNAGVGINEPDQHGKTLLHHAATRVGRERVDEFFLDYVKIREERRTHWVNTWGRNHLDEPRQRRTWLNENVTVEGVDFDAVDQDGNTPLHLTGCMAPESPVPDMMADFLYVVGANFNARNNGGETPLITIVRNNRWDAECLDAMGELGCDVNAQDIQGNTVLHYVAASPEGYGTKAAIQALKALGADVSLKNLAGQKALHGFDWPFTSAEAWRMEGTGSEEELLELKQKERRDKILTESFEELFNRDCKSIDCSDDLLRTPLYYAAERGNLDLLKVLWGEHPHSIYVPHYRTDINGKTLLHAACHLPESSTLPKSFFEGTESTSQKAEMVQYIATEKKHDIWRLDDNGNTVLHEAALWPAVRYNMAHRRTLIQKLLDLGAPDRHVNKNGQTALHLAVLDPRVDAPLDLFLKSLQRKRTFYDWTCSGLNLPTRLDVDHPDRHGRTPLHLASTRSEYAVAQLLDVGADPRKADRDGRTPLHFAARAREPNIILQLLDAVRNNPHAITAVDIDGRTPLHDAARSGIPESVQALLAALPEQLHRKALNSRDNKGRNILHAATESADEDVLWKSSTDFQRPRPMVEPTAELENHFYGESPHISEVEVATPRVRDVVRILRDGGVDVEAHDSDGKTPVQLAWTSGATRVANELLITAKTTYQLDRTDEPSPGQFYRELFDYEEHRVIAVMSLDHLRSSITSRDAESRRYRRSDLPALIKDAIRANDQDFVEVGLEVLLRSVQGRTYGPNNIPFELTPAENPIGELARQGWVHTLNATLITAKEENAELELHAGSVDEYSHTALHLATVRRTANLETIRLLLSSGIDIDARTYGTTALMNLAAADYYWQPKALEMLLQAGADANAANYIGSTVLDHALSQKGFWREKAVGLLLAYGADPDEVGEWSMEREENRRVVEMVEDTRRKKAFGLCNLEEGQCVTELQLDGP